MENQSDQINRLLVVPNPSMIFRLYFFGPMGAATPGFELPTTGSCSKLW
jgi:hypothetical protein